MNFQGQNGMTPILFSMTWMHVTLQSAMAPSSPYTVRASGVTVSNQMSSMYENISARSTTYGGVYAFYIKLNASLIQLANWSVIWPNGQSFGQLVSHLAN